MNKVPTEDEMVHDRAVYDLVVSTDQLLKTVNTSPELIVGETSRIRTQIDRIEQIIISLQEYENYLRNCAEEQAYNNQFDVYPLSYKGDK